MLTSHNFSHKRHILAYVYGPLLKRSLDDFKVRWNSHRIKLQDVQMVNGMMAMIVMVIYIIYYSCVHLGTS